MYLLVLSTKWEYFARGIAEQRWSSRGHILKSLALASKVKSLASKPPVLENWPVLGSRTALFLETLKFCKPLEKVFWRSFFLGKILWTPFFWDRLKKNFEDLFFWRTLAACVLGPWPWPRAFLSLASRGSVLRLGFFLCPWPRPRALCLRLHLCRRVCSVQNS